MTPDALIRIERLNYALGGAVVIASALLLPRAHALGLAVGIGVSCVNFSLLRRLVARILFPAPDLPPAEVDRQRSRAAVLFVPKLTGLVLAIFLAVHFLPISPVALALGFSIFFVSIAIETVRFLTGPRRESGEVESGRTGGAAPGGGPPDRGDPA